MRFFRFILGMFFLFSSVSSFAIGFVGQTPKVLPLGDSITSGRFEPSYRHKLKLLTDASSTVNLDFIGTLDSLNPPVGFTDQQHEGWSGRTAGNLLNEVHPDSTTGQSIIDHALATLDTPDIALVHLGTNNLLFTNEFINSNLNSIITTATNNLSSIITKLRSKNPNMVIFLAQIIPLATDSNTIPGFESGSPNIPAYNVAIAQLASDLNTASSPIITVDQFTGIDQATDLLTDGIHPTESGEQKIAQQWFNALEPFFIASGNTTAKASWPLSENTGTLAADQSSNGIDLTINNGATWIPGQSGSALDFNGVNQNASTPNATALQSASVTLSAWVNPRPTSVSNEWIAAQADNYGLYIAPNSRRVAFYIRDVHGGWTDVFSSNNAIQFNQWQHIVGSYEASSKIMNIYVDGVLVGTHTFGDGILYDTGSNFDIGAMTNQRFFDGGIDEVQVFDAALTPAEIAQSSGGNDTPPVITPIGANPLTIQVDDVYSDAGATAIDVEDGSLNPAVDATAVNTAIAGTYFVHFTVTDSAGNVANVARSVVVVAPLLPPVITSPVAGSTLTANTEAFTWVDNGNNVTEWWLHAGSAEGLLDYYDSRSLGTSTNTTVTGLPVDSSTIYIRLWYKVGGTWLFVDSTYIAAGLVTLPEITSPTPESTFTSSTVPFSWIDNGIGATEWWLYAGSAEGLLDYHDSGSLGASLNTTVTGLPEDGSIIYVRLWYKVAGVWSFVDYTYVAAVLAPPVIVSPVAGSTFTSSSEVFTWVTNDANVTEWWLYAGSAEGLLDYYDSGSLGVSLSATITGLPVDGSMVYVRLWYKVAGVWQKIDVTYLAASPS